VVRRTAQWIALDFHGADRDLDSDVRAQVRRLVKKARFLMKGGYLESAAGERPRL